MKNLKSKIDTLVNIKENLEIERQRKIDSMHERNSKIGTKIKKLENKSYHNKVQTDAVVAEIDREISKTKKLIKLEQEYVCSLADTKFKNFK